MPVRAAAILIVLASGIPPSIGCGSIDLRDRHDDAPFTDERAGPPADLYVSAEIPESRGFTEGIEGPEVLGDQLYAVNYGEEGVIGRFDTRTREMTRLLKLPEGSVGNSIRFDERGHMFIADYRGHQILRVDVATRAVSTYVVEPRMSQPNDLVVMRDGTMFATDPDWSDGSGRLWRIEPSGGDARAELVEDDMGTTNGIALSPDDRTLFVGESIQRRIWAYDVGPDGRLSNKRLIAQYADGGLDGMRVDMQGRLFVTRFGKGTIEILSARGELLREVELAGKRVTNLAFGGADGRTCFVTVQDSRSLESFRTEHPGREWHILHRR